MATLLAHIRIKPDQVADWEAVIEDMVKQTFANEDGVVRYEYWRTDDPSSLVRLAWLRTDLGENR